MYQKRTKEVEDAILQSIRNGATITDALLAAGIGKTSFHQWRKSDPEFDVLIDEAKSSRVEIIEDVVYMAAKKGDVRAALEWLKHKHNWRTDIHITGKIEHQINEPTDADIIAVAQEIIKNAS